MLLNGIRILPKLILFYLTKLVLSGDFCQLPPVPEILNGIQQPIIFAFEAKTWDRCVTASMILNRVFRQKDRCKPCYATPHSDWSRRFSFCPIAKSIKIWKLG